MKGVIDVHYASLTSQGAQRRVFHLDGHPSRCQRRPTGFNFGEQTGIGVFPLVIAVTHVLVRYCFFFLLFFVLIHDLQCVIFRENGSQNLEHRLSPFLFWREE